MCCSTSRACCDDCRRECVVVVHPAVSTELDISRRLGVEEQYTWPPHRACLSQATLEGSTARFGGQGSHVLSGRHVAKTPAA